MAGAVRMPHFLREWTIRFSLVIVSCLVAIVFAEIMARIFFPISDGRDNVTLDGKPVTGWFPPGTVYRQISNEYDALTTITEKGHRVPGVDGNPEVIFIGDSFTYGFGLNDDETFANIYCKVRRHACVNLGIPGSGTSRQLERLKRFLDEWGWKPKEVKLFFFGMSGSFSAGNDFVDNYNTYMREHGVAVASDRAGEAQRPAVNSSVGVVERVIALQSFILDKSTLVRLMKYYWGPLLKSMVVADPGKARMDVALIATKEGLVQLDEMSRRMGFEYQIYLLVPVQDIIRGSYGETLAALNRVSPKPAIATAHLFVDSPEKYYYAFDGHLNAKGSRRVADFLVATEVTVLGDEQRQ